MDKQYEVDLDLVWNLKAGAGVYYDEVDNSYCAIGKVLAAAGEKVPTLAESMMPKPDLLLKINRALANSGFYGVFSFGASYNDRPMKEAKTPEERQLAHEKACRKLLEILLDAKLIKLKDSDLQIVRELKQRELKLTKELQNANNQ